jgi:ribosomal protein S18 acetylase RimI-like enzyme
MDIELREEPTTALDEYGRIPIAFEVNRVLDVSVADGGLGGILMSERNVEVPYIKDYDAIDGEGPVRWAQRFDLSNWGLISAYVEGVLVGGAVIAFNMLAVDMLEARADLAVIWDIRVLPEFRRRGVGSALFRRAEEWAAARACRQLKVETQNINVAACRFYERQGCVLGVINRFAYRNLAGETQLIWYKEISVDAP